MCIRDRLDRGETVAVNLGNGKGASVREVIDTVRRVTGRDVSARDAPRRPGDPAVLVADARKAHDVFGWAAQRSDLATIIADAWRWHSVRFGAR